LKTLFKFFFLIILVVALWLAYGLLLRINPDGAKYVLLRPGWSTAHIAAELRRASVIRSAPSFLLFHYLRGKGTLKAGEYRFDRPANALQVRNRLAHGDIYVHTVVVPEGFNIFEIAAAMEAAGLGPRDEFLKITRSDATLVSDLDPEARSLEGFLFPDTYQFTRTQSIHDIVGVMVKRFRQEARVLGLATEVHRVVTLASIIEKETAVPEERPLVASVYENRLQRNIALGADPTVIYAAELAGRYNGVIHQSDLQLGSPYNTYKYPGLPPGPIANPGRGSLAAAMHPATTAYLYFVSDNQGHHRFASNLDEHSHNVAAYRRSLGHNR